MRRYIFWNSMLVLAVLLSPQVYAFETIVENGGWCWFQDPRVVISNGKLVVGSVEGNGRGAAVAGVYDLDQKKQVGTAILHGNFQHDDHNAPAFYVRPDGSLLAVYALHNINRSHYYRISEISDYLQWGEENEFIHNYPRAGNVTYMNLYALEKEKTLYNFFRGIEWNPSYIFSKDGGQTWEGGTCFIKSELPGNQRPYARYTSDGVDTIYTSFTDAHPRQFGNSMYYAAFREGAFYRADGTRIKSLSEDGPLLPSEAECVFKGGGGPGPGGVRGVDRSAENSAWTSSIVADKEGRPHIGYTVHLSNSDHRYRFAHWDGEQWVDREVAYAGDCLYGVESSYTGLITLDPGAPDQVAISTNVDPRTGEDTGEYEIYRAILGAEDDINSIQWEAVTQDSTVQNLRPIIVRGDGYRVLLWLRGEYRSYTNYKVDVVGLIERVENVDSNTAVDN